MEELYESDEKDMQDMLEEKLGEGGHVVDHDDMHYATNQDRRVTKPFFMTRPSLKRLGWRTVRTL